MFKGIIDHIKNIFMTPKMDENLLEQLKDLTKVNERLQLELDNSQENLRVKNKKMKVLIKHIKKLQVQIEGYQGNTLPVPEKKIREKASPSITLNKLFAEGAIDRCNEEASNFAQRVNPNEYSLEGIRKLTEFLDNVFSFVPQDPKQLTGLYSTCLSIIRLFYKKEVMREFISKNDNKLNRRILDTNDSKLIVELAEFYFNQHSTKHALFIDSVIKNSALNFTELDGNDFIKLLWYCAYVKKDEQLTRKSEVISLIKKYQKIPEIKLFNLYQKMVGGKVNFEIGQSHVSALKKKVSIFNHVEKKKIYKLLEEKLGKLTSEMEVKTPPVNTSASLRKIAFVTKLPVNNKLLDDPNKNLQSELIQLAVYSDPFLKNQLGYTIVKVLSESASGKTFILENEIGALKKKLGSTWPDIRPYSDNVPIVKKMAMNQENSPSFAWPSTEIKGNFHQEEKSNFKEESELKKLGYQITGLTRDKRWRILEVAVKELGLKKVAYTIAQNVKLRKGQKNGVNKFSFSIGEWEHDLTKLKQTYYKKDFTWPTTTVVK